MSIYKTMYSGSTQTGEDDTNNNGGALIKDTYFDVFLGGTVNSTKGSSDWRSMVISKFKDSVKYFNPVVEDYNEYAMILEERAKAASKYKLYVITPHMRGVYSIAEMVHDSIKFGDRAIICVLSEFDNKAFNSDMIRSLNSTIKLCTPYNATICYSLESVVEYINGNTRGL